MTLYSSYELNVSLNQSLFIHSFIPQEFILGPLLFTLYVNDMVSAVTCDSFLYADDSALKVSGKNVKVLETELQNNLVSLQTFHV